MGKRSTFERRAGDFYPTPRAAVAPYQFPTCAEFAALPSRVLATAHWSAISSPSVYAASMPATSAAVRTRSRSAISA